MIGTGRVLRWTTTTLAVLASVVTGLLAWRGGDVPDRVEPLTGAVLAVVSLFSLPVLQAGWLLLRWRPRNGAGFVFLASGLGIPLSSLGTVAAPIVAARPADVDGPGVLGWLNVLGSLAALAAVPLVATFGLLLFPDGRLPAGRRWRLAAAAGAVEMVMLVVSVVGVTEPDSGPVMPNPLALHGALAAVASFCFVSILLVGPFGLVGGRAIAAKARQTAAAGGPGAADRARALHLASRTGLAVLLAYVGCIALQVVGSPNVADIAEAFAVVVIAAAAWRGITHYGLLDTRVLVNRALVWGTLTAVVVAGYLVLVALVDVVAGNVVPRVVAGCGAALLVLPVHGLVQRRVNQLVYGLRDDPAAALGRLGHRVEASASPADVLPIVAATVADALRLPFVAVEVPGHPTAVAGTSGVGVPLALDLPFAGETVGTLRVESRGPDTALRPAELSLLGALARQVAVAANAVRLHRELQDSRERLVSAREEERRQLAADLHDDLGPALAAVALGLHAARRSMPAGSDGARSLQALGSETERVVQEVRRLVHGLRPPALDELGLLRALAVQAERHGVLSVRLPTELPPLPAAVELAVYRIAVEALTNASRHAGARAVSLSLRLDEQARLALEVRDDGVGLPGGYRAGLGIASMRERARELGGTCAVTADPAGTRVAALLPLSTPARMLGTV